MRARSLMVTPLLLTALALAGCAEKAPDEGADEPPTSTPSSTPSGSPSPSETTSQAPEGAVVPITLKDGNVSPAGKRVRVKLGDPVTLAIDADVAGTLHVHSVPEQEVAYAEGMSQHQLTFDRPGVYEVESHEAEAIIVMLEVG